jgi:type VI protein secretion system component VasK
MTVKQMEKKIAALEKRLTVLENKTRRQNGRKPGAVRKTRARRTIRSATTALTEQEKQKRVLEVLRAKGMISEPTEREKQIAAEWMARPEAERTRIMEEFRAVAPGVSLADIVIENRR